LPKRRLKSAMNSGRYAMAAGTAVRGEQLLEERGVAVDVLGGPEVQGQDLARGVVDGAEEHELRAAGLEPRKGTAVDLHQRAPRGLGDAPPARLGWAPAVARCQTELAAQPADGLAADAQPMLLAQLFGEVAVIEADVTRRHQSDRGVPRLHGQAAGRGPAAPAVG